MARIIVKVRETNSGQKLITIPNECDIKKDDYVVVKKLEEANEDKQNN